MFGEIESAETEDVKKPKKHKVSGKGKAETCQEARQEEAWRQEENLSEG